LLGSILKNQNSSNHSYINSKLSKGFIVGDSLTQKMVKFHSDTQILATKNLILFPLTKSYICYKVFGENQAKIGYCN
jgi:hypothetical protein